MGRGTRGWGYHHKAGDSDKDSEEEEEQEQEQERRVEEGEGEEAHVEDQGERDEEGYEEDEEEDKEDEEKGDESKPDWGNERDGRITLRRPGPRGPRNNNKIRWDPVTLDSNEQFWKAVRYLFESPPRIDFYILFEDRDGNVYNHWPSTFRSGDPIPVDSMDEALGEFPTRWKIVPMFVSYKRLHLQI